MTTARIVLLVSLAALAACGGVSATTTAAATSAAGTTTAAGGGTTTGGGGGGGGATTTGAGGGGTTAAATTTAVTTTAMSGTCSGTNTVSGSWRTFSISSFSSSKSAVFTVTPGSKFYLARNEFDDGCNTGKLYYEFGRCPTTSSQRIMGGYTLLEGATMPADDGSGSPLYVLVDPDGSGCSSMARCTGTDTTCAAPSTCSSASDAARGVNAFYSYSSSRCRCRSGYSTSITDGSNECESALNNLGNVGFFFGTLASIGIGACIAIFVVPYVICLVCCILIIVLVSRNN